MQLFKIFKIIIWLPAVVLRGITVASQHCNCMNIFQHRKKIVFIKLISILLLIISTQKIYAQSDTNYIDTTSFSNLDSAHVQNDEEGNDESYNSDTTEKHIYDTSQFFFNSKESDTSLYVQEKITQKNLVDKDVAELKKQDEFWYIPAIEKLETRLKNDPKFRDSLMNARDRQLESSPLVIQPWVRILIWSIIIIVFIGAVIYFLMQNKINLFSRESASGSRNEDDEEHEDIFRLSYTKNILQAEKDGNYRVAIRLMFLQILKSLSETNIIHYQPDLTNLDYLQQLHPTKYYNDFFKVMRNYEYVWYGKFNISQENYTSVKKDFLNLQNKIA